MWHFLATVRLDENEKIDKKLALFYEEIINFQQEIRYRGVLIRKDWKIINRLLVSGYQEDGPD